MLLKRRKVITRRKRLQEYFDIGMAEMRYRLIEEEMEYSFYRGRHTVVDVCWLGTGDKEWARRIAKHYDLSIEGPLEEDEVDA